MTSNVYIIGYYGHKNIGDEQYKLSFKYLFDKYMPSIENIEFVDCDLIKTRTFSDNDIIIVGGGDILNDYFLDEINKMFFGKPNKIIAISVGLPYNEILINSNKLAIIDYIFIRTQQDFKLFSQYYRADRIFYLPDVSYYLSNLPSGESDTYGKRPLFDNLDKVKKRKQKIIAFCLNRHIYTKQTKDSYFIIVSQIAKTISQLVEQGFYMVLLPFNTSGNSKDIENNMENDIIFQNDVFNVLTTDQKINVLNIDKSLTVKQTFLIFDYFYLTVPMRFHACLFSIYKKIPMMPVFTTKKIYNFLLDINWKDFYFLETDQKDIPLKLDSHILFTKINKLFIDKQDPNSNRNPNGNKNTFFNNMKQICTCSTIQIDNDSKTHIKNINNLIMVNFSFYKHLDYEIKTLVEVVTVPFIKEPTMGFTNNTDIVIEKINKKIKEFTQIELHDITDINLQTDIVSIVSYYLTDCFDSKYNHGLIEKMFSKNFNQYLEWSWIIKDIQMNSSMKNNSYVNGIYNMSFCDQNDYSGSHRSGWQYVINSIKTLNNEKSNLFLDLSIDKTFHWRENVNKNVGLIPYKQDWVGFIHHTFDSTFSEYNNNELLRKQTFLDSLRFCKGLIVFSTLLESTLNLELSKLNLDFAIPPVIVMTHPTEFVKKKDEFSWKKFVENDDKKLLHIGGWLRNIFSFYALSIPPNFSFFISQYGSEQNVYSSVSQKNPRKNDMRKVALKGKNMNNYFPTSNVAIVGNCSTIDTRPSKNCSQNSQSSIDSNNWNKHFIDYTKNISDSVEVVEHLSNEKYDEMLTQNIVFLNLVDASAVNTILECIIRNTPIFVNKIPAVVELLGEDYPLYYNAGNFQLGSSMFQSISAQISRMMSDTRCLKSAHKYLKAMNKTRFTVEFFMNDLTEIIKRI
jgi:polysaccharide pyruvyl transferase WcaK-like protein